MYADPYVRRNSDIVYTGFTLKSPSDSIQSDTNQYDSPSKITECRNIIDKESKFAYPCSLNIPPNTGYYYSENGLASNEENNIYYKITNRAPTGDTDDKIKDYITSKLQYTQDREYFERIEKLRFRLPTAEDYSLKSKIPACTLDNRIEEVRHFRENNIAECIRPQDMEFRANHTCVHRYKLNERRFPEPHLVDEDGHSLCSTCHTPSEYMIQNNITPLNCEKRYTIPEAVEEEFPKKSNGFAPILLLEAPEDNDDINFFKKKYRYSRTRETFPFPNSLALSYQRKKY